MGKADGEGIPLEEYIKDWPESLVRGKLDRGELPYTWTDVNGHRRASDDGGPQPPKGWWPRPEFTTINRETGEVRGNALVGPHFPPMYFVKVCPPAAVTNAEEPGADRDLGGHSPVVDWEMVDQEVYYLMDYHGEFSADDPEWNTQAQLEKAISDYCETTFHVRPPEATVRTNILKALKAWRQRRMET